ncbi:hypothetical protein WA158_000490 [Blastocystis sp. Blastoise]
MSLQLIQKNALIQMLNFNQEVTEELPTDTDDDGAFLGRWKVLIYDDFCRNIITPLLNSYELRKYGITLHLSIKQQRDKIPGVPVIYFVQPTEDNIRMIASDCSNNLYDAIYIDFSNPVSNELLSLLAQLCVDNNSSSKIVSIHDQFFSSISLEDSLYTLQMPNLYSVISNPKSTPKLIEECVGNDVPSAIFSLLVNLGCIPAIRASPNGAAQLVAEKLFARIRQEISQPINLFSTSGNTLPPLRNPLLILIDRDIDIAQPLHHTANYQSLMNDVCVTNYNRVTIPATETSGALSYYLDKTSDTFWRDYSGKIFPDAVDGNKAAITAVMEKVDHVKHMTNNSTNQSSDLKEAVETIPQLMEQKKQLEKHTTILKDIMDKLHKRDLPTFYEIEHNIITGQAVETSDICKLITDKGDIEDKIRLINICCVLREKEEIPEYEKALRTYLLTLPPEQQKTVEGAAYKAFQYIKAYHYGKTGNTTNKQSGYDLLKKANSIFNLARAGVKGLIGSEEKCTIINILEELLSGKHTALTDGYIFFDPKTNKQYELKPLYNDVIICVIGGASYGEYLNLQSYISHQSTPRTVFYGGTDILSPTQFLTQLENSYEN